MTETSAEKIVQEQGKVTAVKANRKGEEITLETKAVILADGGFVGNKEEIKRTLASIL
ncbi:FAD-binding protein [Lactobacillus delbrueckii subsp. bulgaricus]